MMLKPTYLIGNHTPWAVNEQHIPHLLLSFDNVMMVLKPKEEKWKQRTNDVSCAEDCPSAQNR
jgi:hypothetical protein